LQWRRSFDVQHHRSLDRHQGDRGGGRRCRLTGPGILRPKREDGAKSFFDPAKPTYAGVWATNAIDLPWDCYQVGSKDWREREKEQREPS
jgi:hypothetical protein